jgi:hypothetical protein
MGLSRPTGCIKHHQSFFGDDRTQQHFARLDLQLEQFIKIKRYKPRCLCRVIFASEILSFRLAQ